MNEKLQIFGQKLLKNIRVIALVFFAIHLIVSYWLAAKERKFREPLEPPPPPVEILEKFPNENYDLVVGNLVTQTKDLQDDARASRLLRVNMFSDKSVASEMEMEASVREDYLRAQQAFSDGRDDEALRLVDAILQRNPTHRGSTELKMKIESKKAEAEAVVSEPGDGAGPGEVAQ